MHPFTGLDHLVAMLAVGVWSALAAAQPGWRSLAAAPLSFAALLWIGALLALGGASLPAVEPMIATSLLVLGLLVATRRALPTPAGMALVGGFALFHGAAHGAELAGPAALAGMVLATGLLHGAGLLIGLQLVIWMLSGLMMSLFDSDAVKGKAFRAPAPARIAWPSDTLPVAQLLQEAGARGIALALGEHRVVDLGELTGRTHHGTTGSARSDPDQRSAA